MQRGRNFCWDEYKVKILGYVKMCNSVALINNIQIVIVNGAIALYNTE